MAENIENVLILQGGGSLGAFGCGIFKALAKKNIKIDIAAGTSIGGVNAAIIAGSRSDHPEVDLQEFWMELAENTLQADSPFTEWLAGAHSNTPQASTYRAPSIAGLNSIHQLESFYRSATFGNRKIFKPRWSPEYIYSDPQYFTPNRWTYVYDHSPLAKTLERYIDYDRLKPGGNSHSRLIITAVNILNAEPLTFDSFNHTIGPKHILATSAYPIYYFPWIEIENGIYAWDGGLLSNTPLREVIDASPVRNKQLFLVENYPKKIDRLPENLSEVIHRERDIMFSDKTLHTIQMSKAITYYLRLIDELYSMLNDHFQCPNIDKTRAEKISARYKRLTEAHGAEIKSIFYITREESSPHIYENADFSPDTIKKSIAEGESKMSDVLKRL